MKQYFVGVDLGSANVVMVVGSREQMEALVAALKEILEENQ